LRVTDHRRAAGAGAGRHGEIPLRTEIARLYRGIAPEQILVHTGAVEPIANFMHAALEPGDTVIVQTPHYQALSEIARSIGADVVPWLAREEHGWAPDLDELPKLITAKTRAVIVNLPHNPTGYLMTAAEQARLVEICRAAGLLLFSDEVYRELEHDPHDTLPAAADLYENAVSLGVMSKTYGLPGLRIGWVATRNGAVLDRMAMLKDYTTICNSAPSEFLSTLALRHRAGIVMRNRGIVLANIKVLDRFFARYAHLFSWVRPRAGSIAFPRLKLDIDVEQFALDAIKQAGVTLLPSTTYSYGNSHFRIGFGRRSLPSFLPHFERYLDEYHGGAKAA
jgi:aspartate/methionine/tyrosine aminotransferase